MRHNLKIRDPDRIGTDAIIYARHSPRPDPNRRRNKNTPHIAPLKTQSCNTQIDFCLQFCALHNYEVIETYRDEDRSGARMDDRPGIIAAMEHVTRLSGTLVVYSLSRLGRSLPDLLRMVANLKKAQAQLASVQEAFDTNTSMGMCFFRILASFDEMQRERIGERTKAAMLWHQAQGRRMSARNRIPFGWKADPDDDERIIDCPEEQQAISRVVELRRLDMSYRQIATTLEAEGIPFRGRPNWHHQMIRTILRRLAHRI